MRAVIEASGCEGDEQGRGRSIAADLCSGWRDECVRPHASRSGTRRRSTTGFVPLQPLQVGANIGSMLVTQLEIFLQRLIDDGFHLWRKSRIELGRRMRLLVEDRAANLS